MNKSSFVKVLETKLKKTKAIAKKRANIIFAAMSVAHVDEETHNPGEVYQVEKVFPNGEVYTGQWANNCPNGHGKYLWKDGCLYVGDWYRGKHMGNGKFSWPSSVTYEGEFKNGYLDGKGTFTGASTDVYKGAWVYNMKHGKRVRHYANGDFYEGHWRRGQQDGKGRYHWSNGNQYIDHWKKDLMNGTGTMMWANGNRYDGNWEDGLPSGNGTFRWEDGRFYVGVWSKDPEEQSGTYYPSSSKTDILDWDPQEVYLSDLSDCTVNVGENIMISPSDKSVNWPCSNSKSLKKQSAWKNYRASVDGGISLGSESELNFYGSSGYFGSVRELDDVLESEELGMSRGTNIIIKPMKKQGITIAKGHKNYELMLNLQLGIRHAVGRAAPTTSLDLKASAFDPKDKVWTRFPPHGSKHTPPHQSCEFKWKDYCPLVFRTLGKLFKVDPADYMISICGNDALRELSSPGKSGSFFYLTNDDKYMIKTMKKSLFKFPKYKVLKKILPAFENTLVTKFFGLHYVKLSGPAQKKVRFVIMGNLFCTEYAIHRRFDLKGSSHGRLTEKPESEIESTTTLKDLDLNFIFRLQASWFQEFSRQVGRDCDFLEQEKKIMDYSLLIGIHFREISQSGELLNTNKSNVSEVRTPIGNEDRPQLSRWTSIRLGSSMPALAELTVRKNKGEPELVGEPTGEYYDVIVVFGIIDILQDYDISKKLKHAYKSFQYDAASISAVDPRLYSKRFHDFIFRIFTEDDTSTSLYI